jgi:tetratricopeptide (TPR) repeat protein
MKLKPLYFYLGLIIIVIVYLIISTQFNDNKSIVADSQDKLPRDEIHQGMNPPGQQAPGKNNVSGDILKHMAFLKKAVEENPNDTAKIREYADFLYMAHQTDKALPLYIKLVKLKPKDNDAHFSLTYIYYQAHDLDKAERETDIILSYDKNNPQALYNKGAIVAGKGDMTKAQKIWNEVIARFPGSEAAQLAKSALQKL